MGVLVAAESISERILGQTWTIRQVFSGRRYGLDSYQREYAWDKRQVEDLVNDLTGRFRKEWSPQHELPDVARYQPYFLGPIITFERNGMHYLIDGQQRLTTLMLLLMWLLRIQEGRDDAVDNLGMLVYSVHFGQKSFAVDDPERRRCLEALLAGVDFDVATEASTSVRNLWQRYADIDQLFPEDLRDEELPFFIYWLLDRVMMVEVSTHNDTLALEIFETMNDRGLRLTSLDMLKSFVLAQVNADDREVVNRTWRQRLTELTDIDPNAHSAFVKSWLRAKYSAGQDDDENIGSAFDKWVRKEAGRIGLDSPAGFRRFVVRDMDRLAGRYRELLQASRTLTPGLEAVFYNAYNSVTLQLPLILAAVGVDDDDEIFARKARMVAGYLDIFVARSMVNAHDFRYTSVEHRMFALAREIRDMDCDILAKRLGEEIASIPDTFDAVSTFSLRPRNRSYVKYLLARMAAWMDAQCGAGQGFATYARPAKDHQPFEIEHIWADKFEYQPQLPRRRFTELRNRLGALVLLPKDINASFGDLPYARKLPKYMSQNLLTRSLHPHCYENNPTFLRMIQAHQLPFTAFAESFDATAIDSRQELYRRLCELTWNPTQYGLDVPIDPPSRSRDRRAHFGMSLRQLVDKGAVPAGCELVGSLRGIEYRAQVTEQARIRIESGEQFESPSPAAMAVLDRQSWNGWLFWQVINSDGTVTKLDDIRKTAMAQAALTGS